jgi:protein gp37
MNETIISWTNKSWNPWSGCTKISAGCKNCYAFTVAENKRGTLAFPNGFDLTYRWHKLNEPLKIKEPSLIFVNSMSDLFWERVSDDDIRRVFEVMNKSDQLKLGHSFQILTKRPERVLEMDSKGLLDWTDNIWQGVTVENNKTLGRIDLLRQCRSKVKFISFEPLLEDIVDANLTDIDWAIVGGESGSGYRSMEQEWARSIRDACLKHGTAFFYKQDSGYKTELRPFLVESDGSKWKWQQMPKKLLKPILLAA